MRIPIRAVLFKRITEINWRAMTGQERGQYDLRLGTDPEFEAIFDILPPEQPTPHGGWSRRVTLEPFAGPEPVASRDVTFRYMGPQSRRKDYYFASQKYDLPQAYPLWLPGRTAPLDASFTDVDGSAVVVVRDVEDRFHGRWVSADEVLRLPPALRKRIEEDGKGVYQVSDAQPTVSTRAQEVLEALVQHHNVLLYGPPGTGKTFIVQEVLRAFGAVTIDTEAEHDAISHGSTTHTLWATFHQSYSYEDFIVGLRPRPLPAGGFTLQPVAGTLLELSEWARDPGRRSLLIIDEINRGNVSRIFGELITQLDVDKRLGADGHPTPTTVFVRLPYVSPGDDLKVTLADGIEVQVPYPFTLPHDVYVLATMNSVDTSVAPLDAALRRRFTMVQLSPDLQAMRSFLGLGGDGGLPSFNAELPDRAAICALALHVLHRLNEGIAMFLGADFQFGHWYLASLVATESKDDSVRRLVELWRDSLLPQLIEYFTGRTEQLLAVLLQPESSGALQVAAPDAEWETLGASSYVAPGVAPSDEEVLQLLVHIAGVALPEPE